MTNQKEPEQPVAPISNTNGHLLVYGSSGSGKTSFLKHYLNETKANFIVFGRNSTEFHEQTFLNLLQLEIINMQDLENKAVRLDNAGAFKKLKTKEEDLFKYISQTYTSKLPRTICQRCFVSCKGNLLENLHYN